MSESIYNTTLGILVGAVVGAVVGMNSNQIFVLALIVGGIGAPVLTHWIVTAGLGISMPWWAYIVIAVAGIGSIYSSQLQDEAHRKNVDRD